MNCLVCAGVDLPPGLYDQVLIDRRRQFVDRMQWDLCISPTGLERDEYDDDQSDYLVVESAGKHMGSCRVRPTNVSSMVTDHFLASFPDARNFLQMQNGRLYELTRFCRSPDISQVESRIMLGAIAELIDEYRDRKGLAGFIAIVFPKVARFMDKIGMRYVVLDRSTVNGEKVLLICITNAKRSIEMTRAMRVEESKTHLAFGTRAA